jgi:hypothetical protein
MRAYNKLYRSDGRMAGKAGANKSQDEPNKLYFYLLSVFCYSKHVETELSIMQLEMKEAGNS